MKMLIWKSRSCVLFAAMITMFFGCGPQVDLQDLGELQFEIPKVPGADKPIEIDSYAPKEQGVDLTETTSENGSPTDPSSKKARGDITVPPDTVPPDTVPGDAVPPNTVRPIDETGGPAAAGESANSAKEPDNSRKSKPEADNPGGEAGRGDATAPSN